MSTLFDITTIDYSGDLRVDALLQVGVSWNYLLPARTTWPRAQPRASNRTTGPMRPTTRRSGTIFDRLGGNRSLAESRSAYELTGQAVRVDDAIDLGA